MRLGILVALLLCGPLALAQEAVDIAAEPHYHLLLENDQVRVSALTLHPDESALVHLQHSFMTVTLQDGEIIIWDEGKSPIQHFQVHNGETSFQCWSPICVTPQLLAQGISGGFRNDRQKVYRNITVEFLDPNIGWNIPEGGGLVGFASSMFLGGAIVANVLLQPGDAFPAPEKQGAELVIPVSDVDLKGAGGIRIRKSPGDVAWIPVAHTAALTNTGREPARFIIVEFQPDTPSAPPAP
jgi:hypothetical protein